MENMKKENLRRIHEQLKKYKQNYCNLKCILVI